MEFNMKTCTIMQCTIIIKKRHHTYYMKGHQLETVQHHSYSDIKIGDNLKFNVHIINNISKKESSVLGFLNTTLNTAHRRPKNEHIKA